MVNFAPDSLMIRGGLPIVGLAGPDPSGISSPIPGTSQAGTPSGLPSSAPSPRPFGSSDRPWLDSTPSGSGSLASFSLPAPWTGGTSDVAHIDVYTPPGYTSTGRRSYPVIYEVPWTSFNWAQGSDITTQMNVLIDDGAIPPAIVVFIDESGGPHIDSECANSSDGHEWFDRYVSQTVVSWVDSKYRTIARPTARAVMGMSQGGYCAAILALRHPDVFAMAISFSGYFEAGVFGTTARTIFGGDNALLAAASPILVAPRLAPAARASLAFIVVSEPTQPLYGDQAAQFDQVLQTGGYPYIPISSSAGHGWTQVRHELPAVLQDWASRLAALKVL
jgi:enterochelin esterase-like enzyme